MNPPAELLNLKAISVCVKTFQQLEDQFDELDGWMFRGQKNPSWRLESSVERAARRCWDSTKGDSLAQFTERFEQHCFREFRRRAHTYFQSLPELDSTTEWLSWMQHYGAPTRLIDFTRSRWAALFFACENLEPEDKAFTIWAVKPSAIERPSSGNKRDRNLMLGILLNRDHWERRYHNEPDVLREHDPKKTDDLKRIERLEPFLVHDRIALQKGEFLFAYDLSRPFLSVLAEQLNGLNNGVRKLVVSRENVARTAMMKLASMNCDAATLFPGPEGFGRGLGNWFPESSA